MSIILSAEFDPLCRKLSEFLYEQLSRIEVDEVEVATWLDFDGMVGGAAIEFPLLQVYRLRSVGTYLETSEINIDYYLYSAQALAERPGILRLVEVAIAHLLTDKLPHSGLSDLARVRVQKSDRGYLKSESGEIFPFARVTAELVEVDVTSPVV